MLCYSVLSVYTFIYIFSMLYLYYGSISIDETE